tara:strand:- start:8824 stop:9897 length:1074 start_codon:yes stop_codon:yes gene_type:complete
MSFNEKLLLWFQDYRRTFPWRENNQPYNVWLSEIILQQTRAAQGLPYYQKFITTFPDVHSLAKAEEEQVLRLWQGLGYYSRARNLHATAREIVSKYKGQFPENFDEIKKLRGIGDYTASAIASICYGQQQAVVDGNVYRVLSRIFGMDTPIDATGAHKIFKSKSTELMSGAPSGDYNQALMEFGALQCTPKQPDCKNCIFNKNCVAYQQNLVNSLPVKTKKIKVKKRFLNYIILIDGDGKTVLEKRTQNDIWKNLYQFPLIEQSNHLQKINGNSLDSLLIRYGIERDYFLEKWNNQPIIHKLTHQHLEINFWILKTQKIGLLSLNWASIDQYPMPKALQNFKENFLLTDCDSLHLKY